MRIYSIHKHGAYVKTVMFGVMRSAEHDTTSCLHREPRFLFPDYDKPNVEYIDGKGKAGTNIFP